LPYSRKESLQVFSELLVVLFDVEIDVLANSSLYQNDESWFIILHSFHWPKVRREEDKKEERKKKKEEKATNIRGNEVGGKRQQGQESAHPFVHVVFEELW
jgi:hypothetical protein